MMTPNPEFIISDETSLRALFPPTHDLAIKKEQTHLDKHARDFISRAPFVCVGTQNAAGKADVSPRGDPAGFVKILDDHTLAIPDRPGNNRLDTLANITSDPNVGLLFMIPGFDDTLRVNGRAELSTDPELLATMQVNDRTPTIAIILHVAEAYMHCAKAFRRSKLWNPDHHQDRRDMPSLMNIMLDQSTGAPDDTAEMEKLDAALEEGYKRSLY